MKNYQEQLVTQVDKANSKIAHTWKYSDNLGIPNKVKFDSTYEFALTKFQML